MTTMSEAHDSEQRNYADVVAANKWAMTRIEALEIALRNLVIACSPTGLSREHGWVYGVRMPEKEIVEAARNVLEAKGDRQ
jgi:hypothetical protein